MNNFVHSFTSPRPNRRTDIVNRWNTRFLKFLFHPKIKIRCINPNKNIRFYTNKVINQTFSDFQYFGQTFNYLNKASYCQFFLVIKTFKSFRLHTLATDTNKSCIRTTFFNRTNKMCTKQITRCLSNTHCNRERSSHIKLWDTKKNLVSVIPGGKEVLSQISIIETFAKIVC